MGVRNQVCALLRAFDHSLQPMPSWAICSSGLRRWHGDERILLHAIEADTKISTVRCAFDADRTVSDVVYPVEAAWLVSEVKHPGAADVTVSWARTPYYWRAPARLVRRPRRFPGR